MHAHTLQNIWVQLFNQFEISNITLCLFKLTDVYRQISKFLDSVRRPIFHVNIVLSVDVPHLGLSRTATQS
jgi:hypothetical protein